MTGKHTTFRCEICTPEGTLRDLEVRSVTAPALDGYLGVLPNRAPMTAVLGAGQITLEHPGGDPEILFVSRGFLHVRENHMVILSEECTAPEKLDPEAIWEELQRAYKLPNVTNEQRALHDEAVDSARIKFAIAQKARKAAREGEKSIQDIMSGGL